MHELNLVASALYEKARKSHNYTLSKTLCAIADTIIEVAQKEYESNLKPEPEREPEQKPNA